MLEQIKKVVRHVSSHGQAERRSPHVRIHGETFGRRLIGAPPDYVGYDEGGALTEAVRCRPYQVVLFDQIENAHPDVFNVLLQVPEDGRLTDGQGQTVDFRNTLIVMTSNLGSEFLVNQPEGEDTSAVREHVMQRCKRISVPSFSTASTRSSCSTVCRRARGPDR